MDVRYASSPQDAKYYGTERLREEFLIPKVFVKDEITFTYSHVDRIIAGGAMPVDQELVVTAGDELRVKFFLQRREMGIINIGGPGIVTLDGKAYEVANKEAMYVGMGTENVRFSSTDKENPAKFYINSAPAHKTYPTVLIKQYGEASEGVVIVKPENMVEMGAMETSNHRDLCKYIVPDQVDTCQLTMGMTALRPGSVWNTMPVHVHERRMEVYFYFEVPEDSFVMHLMGQPQETRHIFMHNEQAVISPSWSIHSAAGLGNYTFIWGMVGENQEYADQDWVATTDIR